MKTTILFLTLLTLILTACGTASSSTGQADTAQQATAIADIVSATQTAIAPASPVATQAVTTTNSATLNTDFTNAATMEMQLLVGIFKLEGTVQAITGEQAKSLVTFLTSLQGNDLTQDQITSTVQQMQALLTADQINAIAQMQITQESAMTIMQEQGLSMGGRGQGNGQQPPQDGTLPQGTPPALPNGQQPTDGQGQPPAQPDDNGQGQGRGMIPPPLLEALIQLLQTKTSAS